MPITLAVYRYCVCIAYAFSQANGCCVLGHVASHQHGSRAELRSVGQKLRGPLRASKCAALVDLSVLRLALARGTLVRVASGLRIAAAYERRNSLVVRAVVGNGEVASVPKHTSGVLLSLRGINVQRPWARKILDGEKTLEARRYPLKGFLGEDLWIIETRGAHGSKIAPFRSQIIGVVRFGADFKYTDVAEWRADERMHCIAVDSPFDWTGPGQAAGGMYGWRIESARYLKAPQPGPEVKGMICCKAVSREVEFAP